MFETVLGCPINTFFTRFGRNRPASLAHEVDCPTFPSERIKKSDVLTDYMKRHSVSYDDVLLFIVHLCKRLEL